MDPLEKWRLLMASFDDATLQRQAEELDAEAADPQRHPPLPELPQEVGPFGMSLQEMIEVEALLQAQAADRHAVRAETLEDRVRGILEPILQTQGELGVPNELLNRHIVDELEQQLWDQPLETYQRLDFLELTARLIEQAIASRAWSAAGKEGTTPEETLKGDALSATTIRMAERCPTQILRTIEAIDSFAEVDPTAAQYLRLAIFAGRPSEEIATLVDKPAEDVLERLKWAMTEVSLEG